MRVFVRMLVSKMIAVLVIVMMMGRRMNGLSSGAFDAQVFFRIRAERRDAMLRAKEILAAVVHNSAGRPGGIDLHPAHEIREQGRPGWVVALALQSLGVHGYILATIPG